MDFLFNIKNKVKYDNIIKSLFAKIDMERFNLKFICLEISLVVCFNQKVGRKHIP
jgi:hypothetical protein